MVLSPEEFYTPSLMITERGWETGKGVGKRTRKRKGDGTEDLPVLNCVHSHSVEVVALDLHVW